MGIARTTGHQAEKELNTLSQGKVEEAATAYCSALTLLPLPDSTLQPVHSGNNALVGSRWPFCLISAV